MNKLEYLKLCITSLKIIENKNWYINCFAIPVLKETEGWENKAEQYSIVTKMSGLHFVDIDSEGKKYLVKINDFKQDTALFTFQDVIEVDQSWLPTIKSKINTKIGVLIINAMALYGSLGTKITYYSNNNNIKVSDIESLLIDRVKNDDERGPDDISVKEMINCIDRLNFFKNLANLISIAATPKAITPPPNIDAERKKLTEEYKDQMNDPVKVVELKNKLDIIDIDYLKDDPAKPILKSKKAMTARRKMFLIYGETNDFIQGENTPIIPSLSQGVDTSSENFPKYMNDLRFGSSSRGDSTKLSGYGYKVLQRSIAGMTILNEGCNTTKGVKRIITKKNFSKLVNRYIKTNGWKLVDNIKEAESYVGKIVEIRSTMYCTAKENTVCYKCMSENYKHLPNGVNNLAASISSTLMNLFLKIMHGTTTEIISMEMDDMFS